ncbi:hypothetical protein C806_01811 [Lachnospiraceae bacterium 3-1]|nr:hypothetical protein C806_01811 [Lachnospiraceae bacterium 3-1]
MEFRDLKKQYQALKQEIEHQISNVISSSQFISGFQVGELEEKLAEYVGVKHCITCGNGTDAITLALMAWEIGPGDVVFVPDFTFFSSGECPAYEGAIPIFVDVEEDTYNMDPKKLEKAIIKVINEGKYKAKAVITVDLFGLPANYDAIQPICEKYKLLLLEDGAQGFGGSLHGQLACSFGDISTTSFFPAKPLGCYGDGGAIFTDNDEWASLIRSYGVHGKSGEDKYNNIRIGMNSRLDTIQAAILLPKLNAFKEYELRDINKIANMYTELLSGLGMGLPIINGEYVSSWAQYTIQLPENVNRAEVQQKMSEKSIPTMVYYMKPMHRQEAFMGTESSKADCPVTVQLCNRVLSLPIHPYMKKEDVNFVANSLKQILTVYK